MTRAEAQRWLDDYIEAWKTYDRDRVMALFSEDAEYRYHPYDDEPVRGRQAIAEAWVGEDRRDSPGTYDAEYAPVAIDGEVVVAVRVSRYYTDATRKELAKEFRNAYIMRFDSEGRCSSFTEYYNRRPEAL